MKVVQLKLGENMRKQLKKILRTSIAIVMILASLQNVCLVEASTIINNEGSQHTYSAGEDWITYIQAEDTDYVTLGNGGSWEVVDNQQAIGGKAVTCKTTASDATGDGITLRVNIPTDGTYQIWGRVYYPSQTENSLFYAVDGGDTKIWDFADEDAAIPAPACYKSWQYFYLTDRAKGTYSDTTKYGTFTIENSNWRHAPNALNLTAGVHEITITGREAGVILDEIVISTYSVDKYDPNAYEGNNCILETCKFCGSEWKHYYSDVYAQTNVTAEEHFVSVLHTEAEETTAPIAPSKNDGGDSDGVEDGDNSDNDMIIETDRYGNRYATVSLTDSGLMISPSFDMNGNIASLVHSPDTFAEIAQTFADMEVNRVYVVVNHGGVPAASSAANQWNDPGDTVHTIVESLTLSGDPNFEFLYACHKMGLEVIAVYKPYEGGGVSKGEDADMSNSLYYEETVGGNWTGYDAFISAHPELRLKRLENDAEDEIVNDTVTKIDAAFFLDAYTYKNWLGGNKSLSKISDNDINTTPIKLYVSKNNVDYVEYAGEYTVDFTIENRQYLNENGWPLIGSLSRCLVATINNIEIGSEYQYFALTMEDRSGRTTISQSMINIYNSEGEKLPTTVGSYVRYKKNQTERPEDYIWGAERTMLGTKQDALKYFQSWGFEFDFQGTGVNDDTAFISSYVYGIARGNFEYAKGRLCEAYTEVQDYWLSEVESLMLMGYDGIEIRLQSHSNNISDYAYYGFNEPIIEAYKEKYGEDISTITSVSKEVAYRIACIRGEYFMDFMDTAAEMVHDAGKKFGFHVRSGMIDTSKDAIMNTSLHNCFSWTMPKIVFNWKEALDLCDMMTIKQNFGNNYKANLVAPLTEYAESKDIEIWVTAYTQQTTVMDTEGYNIGECNPDFFNKVAEDLTVDGIQLYEWDPVGINFTHAFEAIKKDQNFTPQKEE